MTSIVVGTTKTRTAGKAMLLAVKKSKKIIKEIN